MDKNKLAQYELSASVHTVVIRSVTKPLLPSTVGLDIVRSGYMQKTGIWTLRINPNKLAGDLFTYSEFCAAMHEVCQKLQIEEPIYSRVDIRLDSYEDSFQAFYKLNLLLISLFCILFNDTNRQASGYFLTGTKEFTDCTAQNNFWQVKYYNKQFQTNDTDPAKARLEFRHLRSTNKTGYSPSEIKEKWFCMLDKLPSLYEQVQNRYNEDLYIAYKKHCFYNSKSKSSGDHLTSFLSNYNNGITIFTRRQLRNFFILCGVSEKSAESRVDYIISKVNIEFFSKSDIERYVKKIKTAMDDFFNC